MQLKNEVYYYLKPVIPRNLQIYMRRALVRIQLNQYRDVWPMDQRSVSPEYARLEWPDDKSFALVLTHDVESSKGVTRCLELAEMEKSRGLKSSFNFVPEGYDVPDTVRHELINRGFEVGVHGLLHDGKLYESETTFRQRAEKINYYLSKWDAVGFRSPAMHHNLDWIGLLNIEYDASTFDTDPFEPQSDGVRSIFPFWVESQMTNTGYVELPYTLPQDFTLFVLMQEKTASIWKSKLDWIAANKGMALVNVHPDYLNLGPNSQTLDEFPASLYEDFLDYVVDHYKGKFWNALPKDVARFSRSKFCGQGESRACYEQNSLHGSVLKAGPVSDSF